jgi:hypothetical protein
MRALEKEYIEKKTADNKAAMHEAEAKEFAETIAPVMAEAEVLLKGSGENISHGGLEALARWKLGL